MKLLNSKKAMGMGGFPKIINLAMAVLCVGVGGLGIFGETIGFTLPAIPSIILYGLASLAGLILILDGLVGSYGIIGQSNRLIPRGINVLIGLLVAVGGTLLLLGSMGKIASLPIPPMVLSVLLLLGGAILLLDVIVGARTGYS